MERKTHSYSLAGQKVGKLLVGEEVANLESMTLCASQKPGLSSAGGDGPGFIDSLTDNAKDSETLEARLETSRTRLYRAESGQTGHQAPEWIKEAQNLSGHTEAAERWVTRVRRHSNGTRKMQFFLPRALASSKKEAPLSPGSMVP